MLKCFESNILGLVSLRQLLHGQVPEKRDSGELECGKDFNSSDLEKPEGFFDDSILPRGSKYVAA